MDRLAAWIVKYFYKPEFSGVDADGYIRVAMVPRWSWVQFLVGE